MSLRPYQLVGNSTFTSRYLHMMPKLAVLVLTLWKNCSPLVFQLLSPPWCFKITDMFGNLLYIPLVLWGFFQSGRHAHP